MRAMDDARRALLAELIDDAGLFPPASLPMADATAQHETSRSGPNGWTLGRFICPAERLEELAPLLGGKPWRLSVIVDWDDLGASLAAAGRFAETAGGRARIELLEARLPADADTTALKGFMASVEEAGLPDPVTPYLEIRPEAALEDAMAAVAEARAFAGERCLAPGAKLRCGGAFADMFPSPGRVAAFLHACAEREVACKCTAGLHHPFRHQDAATGFVQHGFVNLVAAAVHAHAHGFDAAALEEIIADEDPNSFTLDAGSLAWRGLSSGPEEIVATRRALFVAYGSCSFVEPVEDLTALSVLPA